MSLLAPPRPPRRADQVDRDDLEALIEEARRRARRRRQMYAAAAGAVVLSGAVLLTAPKRDASSITASSAPPSRPNGAVGASEGSIAFVRYLATKPSPGTLYVIGPGGSGEREVSRGVLGRWSPDGTTLAVTSRRDGNRELYLMRADGTLLRRLTHNRLPDHDPQWSPDGRSIYFLRSSRDRKRYAVHVVNADGTGGRRLSRDVAFDHGAGVAWSPDAHRIAFGRNSDVYVMNADASGLRNMTRSVQIEYPGAWSPDGRQLTFGTSDTHFAPGAGAIFISDADGTNARRLVSDVANGSSGTWSPDGSMIAFVALRDGIREIQLVNADGSARRTIFRDSGRADKPDPFVSWSPDGSKLAFTSARDGNHDIFVVNVDGTGLRRLTHDPEWDTAPVWLPAPKR